MANDRGDAPHALAQLGEALYEHTRDVLVTLRVQQHRAEPDCDTVAEAVRRTASDTAKSKATVWRCKTRVESWFEEEPSLSTLSELVAF